MGRPELVDVGVFERPHGVRGETTLRRFASGDDFPYEALETDLGRYRVVSRRRKGKKWLLTLDGVSDRDTASTLTGRAARVPRTQLPELPDGGYYFCDLLGFEVYSSQTEKRLGTIIEVLTLAGQDYLELEGGTLVPFAEPLVESVDLQSGRVVVIVPEGLP